ncbi:hypothetical protein [Kitasatospora cinereorecta]|uniref:Uncharacterized protein n=1 Tax=Kitasatospora cinereorecta TaxID=285560 RepID=A0ABW0VB20_9ACTN
MIVVTTPTAATALLLGADGPGARVRSLTPYGALRSATDAFDHLALDPGAEHLLLARTGTESAWYVLRGPALAERLPDGAQHLADAGDLLLVPRGGGLRLSAGPGGAELLRLALAAPTATPRPARRGAPTRRTRP